MCECDRPTGVGMVLPKSVAAEHAIVLHDADAGEPTRGAPVRRLESMPGKAEDVLVTKKNAAVAHISAVEPGGELEVVKVLGLVDKDLSGFLLIFVHATGGVGDGPDGVLRVCPCDVGPEDGAIFLVGLGFPEGFGVDGGDIIGVEEEGFGEAGVEESSGLELEVC